MRSRSLLCGWSAGSAPATVRFDEFIDILGAVVVGELFAGLDAFQCLDEHTLAGLY